MYTYIYIPVKLWDGIGGVDGYGSVERSQCLRVLLLLELGLRGYTEKIRHCFQNFEARDTYLRQPEKQFN